MVINECSCLKTNLWKYPYNKTDLTKRDLQVYQSFHHRRNKSQPACLLQQIFRSVNFFVFLNPAVICTNKLTVYSLFLPSEMNIFKSTKYVFRIAWDEGGIRGRLADGMCWIFGQLSSTMLTGIISNNCKIIFYSSLVEELPCSWNFTN